MSLAPSRVTLPDFIDSRPVSRYQYIVIALCGVVMFIDGFDTQSISYMAPHIAEEWGLSKQVLGPSSPPLSPVSWSAIWRSRRCPSGSATAG